MLPLPLSRLAREQLRRSEEARLEAESEAKEAGRRLLTANQTHAMALKEREEAHKMVRVCKRVWACWGS